MSLRRASEDFIYTIRIETGAAAWVSGIWEAEVYGVNTVQATQRAGRGWKFSKLSRKGVFITNLLIDVQNILAVHGTPLEDAEISNTSASEEQKQVAEPGVGRDIVTV